MAKQPDKGSRKNKPRPSRAQAKPHQGRAKKAKQDAKKLPRTEQALVLRTDFSDDAAWESLCEAIRAPVRVGDEEFRAYVDCVSDAHYDGLTIEQLTALALAGSGRSFVFLVDRLALTHPERPVLVVNLADEPGRTFRVVPSQMWGVENNLSIGNMDFDEFADKIDADGIFRDFPDT